MAGILDVIFMIDVMKQQNLQWQEELAAAISACQVGCISLTFSTSAADAIELSELSAGGPAFIRCLNASCS